ncbi:MAG: hypothetical protein HQM08_18940 [Candidatus Riflebacteria bacterium]|nr:hypothetical protein [Candidatus Riflebacteria bacterium]
MAKLKSMLKRFFEHFFERIANFILGPVIRWKKTFFLTSFLLTLVLGRLAATNTFEYELKDLMGDRPDLLATFEESLRMFGPDDQIMVCIPMETLDWNSLKHALEIRKKLEQIPGVQGVWDLARAIGFEEMEKLSWLNERPRLLKRMLEKLRTSSFTHGFLLALDERAQALFIRPQPLEARKAHELVRAIRKTLNQELGGNNWYIFGYPVFAERYISYLISENSKFILMSFIASLGLSFYLFRSLTITLAVLLVVILPTIWTHGVFAWSGYKVSVFSSLLTPIVLFVALSLAIQFINKFIQVRNILFLQGKQDSREILFLTLKENLPAGFFCTFTTLGGFISQIFSPIQGIRAFSIFSALGCAFALILVYLLLPVVLSTFFKYIKKTENFSEGSWERGLGRFIIRNSPSPKIVIFVAAIFTFSLGIGCVLLKYGKEPLSAFPENDPLLQANDFVQSKFSIGSRQVSLLLQTNDGRFDTMESYSAIKEFEKAISSDTEIVSHFSSCTLVEEIWGELSGAANCVPKNQQELDRSLRLAASNAPALTSSLLNPPFFDRARMIIYLRHGDSRKVEETLNRLQSIAKVVSSDTLKICPTGRLYLSAVVENEALEFQIASMSSSVIGVFFIIGLAFRSWRALWISFVVNILPIVAAMGFMGWLGARLEPATAMGPCICLGTIVDDTIHLLHEFFRDEEKGHFSNTCRIRIMIKYTWAIISVTLIPILGLGILCLSSFGPTKNFGAYSAMTLFIGMFYDLFLTCSLLVISGFSTKQQP